WLFVGRAEPFRALAGARSSVTAYVQDFLQERKGWIQRGSDQLLRRRRILLPLCGETCSTMRGLGDSYDICEYVPGPGEGWKELCRRKVEFYATKLREYERPVFWVDVDAQIIGNPETVLDSSDDMAAFL